MFWQSLFAACAGALLGLALFKFGNPIIFDRLIPSPSTIWELVYQPWPISWGYWLLGGLILLSLKIARYPVRVPRSILAAPVLWLGWQVLAAFHTSGPELTRATLLHFSSCVIWFYLGSFALTSARRTALFSVCLLTAFVLVLWLGFQQHYGGLEATRRYFYEQPNWREYPSEYLKRMASDRIFSTLVYPNAFAGAILLYLPMALVAAWQLTERAPRLLRSVLTGLVGYLALACLFWSGSKSGWLIALLLAIVCLVRVPLSGSQKGIIAAAVLVIGLTAFGARHTQYFQRGATSVGARLDYWHAALTTAVANPILGTGPGTFSLAYAKIKPPEAEMAKLAHNDFLEQASDSGIIGLATYLGFIIGVFGCLYRKRVHRLGSFPFTVWLGILAWSIQALVEFPLYIPALAWPAFTFMGWLCGCANDQLIRIDRISAGD